MGVSKTSDHIQIKNKMPNPSQEPPAPSKAPNEDLKVMDVLCTFKINMRAKTQIIGVPKTNDHIWIKIKMQYPIEEPSVSSKAPIEDLKDMDVVWSSRQRAKIQIMAVSKTSQDVKPQSETSRFL